MPIKPKINPKIKCMEYDLPDNIKIDNVKYISIDTETLGLNLNRDRLCVVQILIKDTIYIVNFPEPNYNDSKNLVKLLSNDNIAKIMHYARFDILSIYKYLNVLMQNNICTRILSKIVRTYTDRHGLKEVSKELLKQEMNKGEQSSYWGAEKLTDSQKSYAANDVVNLIEIYTELRKIAEKEKRMHIAENMFKMLPIICEIDDTEFDVISLVNHH